MPRTKKFYIPGCVLKFARDRHRWLDLLFRAKQKYGLEVLNYIVTSNHIHLQVSDNGNRDTINPKINAPSVKNDARRRRKRR